MRKRLFFSMFALIFLVSFLGLPKDTAHAQSFPDVNSSKEEISFLVEQGIIHGYPDGTFGPKNDVNRQQTAKMISVAKEYKTNRTKSVFRDVPQSLWSSEFIHAVYDNGVMKGVGYDLFNPTGNMTRGQLAVVLDRAFNLTETADIEYHDVAKDTYYAESINKVTVAGIAEGDDKGNFNPSEKVNREEFSVMLARALNDEFKLDFKDETEDEEVVKSVKYVRASTILNMRKGPGTNHDIITQLPNNAEVKVLLDDDRWYYVESSGLKGYVDSSFLRDEPSEEPAEDKKTSYKIVIDAGHGGRDPGAGGYGLREKDMVLDIANKTALYLAENFTDVEVILTRSDDVFLELEDRVKIANDLEADYFISMHLNAFNGIVGGFETFIYNGSVSQETIDRQKDIHSYIINEMKINDRGMKKANFHVLRESRMPALLIEYLFIDNETENDLIRDEGYRTFLAETTAEALAHSFDLKRNN